MTELPDEPGQKRQRSISDRLVLLMTVAVAGVLLLAGGAGLAYMYVEERKEVGQHLTAQAELLASQSVAPVLFRDDAALRTTLSALKYVASVRWAAVMVGEREFARFGEVPPGFAQLRGRLRLEARADAAGGGVLIDGEQILVQQPIRSGSETIGTLYVTASFADYNASFLRLIAAFAAFGLAVVILTLPVLAGVVRQMTRPLRELAALADQVTRVGDRGERASIGPQAADDEVNQLALAFNRMLDALRMRERLVEHQAVELLHSERELRALNANTNRIREEERTRIAREVHDEIGQMMTLLKFDVSWMRTHPGDAEGVATRLAEMAASLDQAVQTVRRISWELRPGILDTLGLSDAIEWLGEDFERRTGVRCRVDADAMPSEIDPDYASNLFRICQELLTNVARHAQASEVNVVLGCEEGQGICLVVEDNGVGMPAAAGAAPTLGLLSVRERVRQLYGEVEVLSRPAYAGASITVRLPLPASTAAGSASEKTREEAK